MRGYSVAPLLLVGLPLLGVLAVVGVVPWEAVVGVACALGVLVLVRRRRAPRPGGG